MLSLSLSLSLSLYVRYVTVFTCLGRLSGAAGQEYGRAPLWSTAFLFYGWMLFPAAKSLVALVAGDGRGPALFPWIRAGSVPDGASRRYARDRAAHSPLYPVRAVLAGYSHNLLSIQLRRWRQRGFFAPQLQLMKEVFAL